MLVGIKTTPKPNYVALDTDLPLKFSKGSISVSLNFEQHPTGTISIESVPETEIEAFRFVYNVIGKDVILFKETSRPIYFKIAAYAETENAIFVDDTQSIKSYNIAISLRGGHEEVLARGYQVRKPKRVRRKIRGAFLNTTAVVNLINKQIEAANSEDYSTFNITSKVKNNKLNLKDFAEYIDVDYEGYSYAIDIPKDAGASFRLNFTEALQRNLRLNSQIVDFNETTIRTRDYKTGKVWPILNQDILYEIELSKQQNYEYRDTVLTGKDGLPFISESQRRRRTLSQLLNGRQQRKPPVRVVLEEGDENPTRPPRDVKRLISIDMNFDFSGPRKTYKKTTLLNGQPVEEELRVYGLAYLAQDIRNPAAENPDADFDTPALLGNANSWWKEIEYQKTTYEYSPSDVSIALRVRDKETNRVLPVKYLDGRQFDARYLTSIVTKGWKLTRFQQEQFDEFGSGTTDLDSRWLTDIINDETSEDLDVSYARAQLRSITFRRVPYTSRTQYRLVPTTNLYDDEGPVPFNVQEIDGKDLGYSNVDKVVTALPDPTFAYPMLVLEESTLAQSFAQMDHPQNIIIRDERRAIIEDNSLSDQQKEQDLQDLKLLPWLTTGEDTYQSIKREILPSINTSNKLGKEQDQDLDIYVEYEINASNQDSKFQYSLQEGTFRTIQGRPPNASVFSYSYEDTGDDRDNTDPFNFEYVIDSTTDDIVGSVESLQYETNDLKEGLTAAKVDLELNNFLNVHENTINLAWFYPEIRPGDYLDFVDDISKGKIRVKSVSFQIDYQDHVNGIPHRVCTGTSLTCGRFEDKTITNRTRPKDESNDGLDVKSIINGEETLGRSIFPNLRTRRNPSGVEID